jgi:hypothetical protein
MYRIILKQAKAERSNLEKIKKKLLTRDQIQEIVERICNTYKEELENTYESVLQAMTVELINDGTRTIGIKTSVDEGHVPWLSKRMPNIDPLYWDKYSDLLSEDHSRAVWEATNNDTHEILDRLGDPETETFNKRGLVLGSVQMGKTLNYIGLIAKAADAGYRFIIVVAGATEVLRGQTQRRVDEGFIHQPSSISGKTQTESQGVLPISLTDARHDFNKMKRDTGFNVKQTNVPVIVVVKKNSRVLHNLLEWVVESLALQTVDKKTNELIRANNEFKTDVPLLFLDDEADYASVNTNEEGDDPTAINKVIRNILQRFSKRSYVAYTATPFANIFINPKSYEDATNDKDLFPENFIYKLGFPSNYMGPNSYFGDDASDSLVTILSSKIDERMKDNFIIDRENDYFEVTALTSELKHAIRNFILIVVERSLRGHVDPHNSMMINAQYRVAIQNGLKSKVKEYLNDLVKSCQAFHGLPEHKAIKDKHIKAMKISFEREFNSKDIIFNEKKREFSEILKYLNLAASIDVLAIHGEAKTKDHLSYDDFPEGRNVIAIGGFSLSRGLTLEGLSVSFLDRTTKMSDTLLQMGRWFGYRDGYGDLCRLYIDHQSHEFYVEINNTINALYAELEFMRSYNLTPKDFGLKVREVPGALQITAKNRMRSATIKTSSWDFWGTKYQSVNLFSDVESNIVNLNAAKELVSNMSSADTNFKGNGKLWRQVKTELIIKFLQSFREPSRQYSLSTMVRKFIEETRSIYPEWNVLFATNRSPSSQLESLRKAADRDTPYNPINIDGDKFIVHQSLRQVTCQPIDNIISIKNAQIAGSDIEQQVLTEDEFIKFKTSYDAAKQLEDDDVIKKAVKNSFVRAAFSCPTLIINPIITCHYDRNQNNDIIGKHLSNEDVDVFIGFSLSFPSLMPNGEIPRGNKQKWAYAPLAIEQEKDKYDEEHLDEEFYGED